MVGGEFYKTQGQVLFNKKKIPRLSTHYNRIGFRLLSLRTLFAMVAPSVTDEGTVSKLIHPSRTTVNKDHKSTRGMYVIVKPREQWEKSIFAPLVESTPPLKIPPAI